MTKYASFVAAALALSGSCGQAAAAAGPSRAAIASKVKAEVAEIVSGINAKDIDKATRYDAPDLLTMESGREPSAGAKADHDGMAMAFKYAPSWHLTLVDEAVDVAKGGDMAVYRGTYDEDSLHDGVPFTHRGNYVAEFKRDPDGMWRMHWSVLAWQSASKKK